MSHDGVTDSDDGTRTWVTVARTRFTALWDELPSLTVLAALPGWGRSEWMRSCRARIERAGAETHWIRTRTALAAALAEDRDEPRTIFAHDVLHAHDDPMWDEIVAVLAARPALRVVASSLDTPVPAMPEGVSLRVLDERDLRFTRDDLVELVAANDVRVSEEGLDDLVGRLKGCPVLVRRQLEDIRARGTDRAWATLAFPFESYLLDTLTTQLMPRQLTGSAFVRMLRTGRWFRRFSAELVSAPNGSAPVADARTAADAAGDAYAKRLFTRFEALPLGGFDVDEESGQLDFVWSGAAWHAFGQAIAGAEREQQLYQALRRTEARGSISFQLYYLIVLQSYDEADVLAFDQLRRILLFGDELTRAEVLGLRASALGGRPNLLLLASELRRRKRGANVQSVRDAEACLASLPVADGGDEFMRFRVLCRRAMAAALADRPTLATEELEAIAEVVDAASDSPVLHEAGRRRASAERVAADLHLAAWTAEQVGRDDLAARFTALMRDLGDSLGSFDRVPEIPVPTR